METPRGAFRIDEDQEADVLELFFRPPVAALTIRLAADVYAHLDPATRSVIGITVHRFRERRGSGAPAA